LRAAYLDEGVHRDVAETCARCPVSEETARVAQAAFPHANCMDAVSDVLEPISEASTFVALF
jgi:hypothetical protein